MCCNFLKDKSGGTSGFICGPGVRGPRYRCVVCHKREATKLCDFFIDESNGTCDRRLCWNCAVSVGPQKDYCPEHQSPRGPGPI